VYKRQSKDHEGQFWSFCNLHQMWDHETCK